MAIRHLPNILSFMRILMVGPVAYLTLSGHAMAALFLFMLAGASDGLDGYLAKRYGWVSRLGSYLDPLADKILLVTMFLVFAYSGVLSSALVAVIIVRDLVILLGALAYMRLIGGLSMAPLWSSKVNTFLQIMLCVTVLAAMAFDMGWLHTATAWLVWIVWLTVFVSGFEYVYRWAYMARQERRKSCAGETHQ